MIEILVTCVFAIVFFRAGQIERSWSLLWCALSVTASLLAFSVLHWGALGAFATNALLFVGITAYRVVRAS
jgi:hypothetical protein